MGLGDQARKAWARMTGQDLPAPKREVPHFTDAPKKAEAAPVRPALKPVSTMKAVEIGGRAPMARAFPELTPQLREGLKRSVQPEKPTDRPPVEREATKLTPKLQPPRTIGPGPSIQLPGIKFVARKQQQQQPPGKPKTQGDDVGSQQQSKARKSLSDYERQDKDAADKQKSADQEKQPGRKTIDQYDRSSGKDKDQDKGISR